jgi:DNA-binding winged helix-turn-helix (wHTH) protein
VLRFGVFELDRSTRELRRQGVLLDLNGKALDLLRVLLEARGSWVTRESIVATVWGEGNLVSDASINQVVLKIRRALRDSAKAPAFIEGRRQQGYRFIFPVAEEVARLTRPVPAPRPGVAEHESERVVEDQPGPQLAKPDATTSRRPRTATVAGVAAFVLTSVALVAMVTTQPFGVDETDISFAAAPSTAPQELRRLGLTVLNADKSTWVQRPGGLTLRTERGDFWRKEDDPVLPPKNIVAKPVRSKWFVAATELVGFAASSPTQQAGLVVLEGDERGNYARLTAAHSADCPSSLAVQKVLEIRDTLYRKSEVVCLDGPTDRIWLEIERRGDEFHFRYKTGEEFWDWRDLETEPDELQLGQRYVGLSAFQGITSHDRQPRDQEPVEATFTRLMLSPSRP